VNLLTPGLNTGDAAGDTYTNIANLNGSRFNDTLIGDNNNNVLNGYGGNSEVGDILTGNGGADTFVFSGGKVTVTDFSHNEVDQIDLGNLNFGAGIDASALQALIDAAPVNSHTLDFGNGQVLTLTNVDVHTLQTSSDFILHHLH
jgi:Ca2+-binding RTX toxin-like protein